MNRPGINRLVEWDGQASLVRLGQREPGGAALVSLVAEANLLLARLETVGLHCHEGAGETDCSVRYGEHRVGSISAGGAHLLLGKAKALQRFLVDAQGADAPPQCA
ncbi:MAG: hypothetical protein HQL87_18975 [Magnetococcales bacterium]|nr:hypothetical protein [Magnetococcales bacterium]